MLNTIKALEQTAVREKCDLRNRYLCVNKTNYTYD
jgi:hypothetical protein